MMPTAKTFDAVLERMPGRLGWTIVHLPLDVTRLWGARGQIKVVGEINGFAFRTSLFPTGRGTHYLLVNKKMQKGGGVRPGAKGRFRLEPDSVERVVRVPQELAGVLKKSKRLQTYYDSFNYSMRRWMADRVLEGKHAETRSRRAEQIAEHLMETLVAERDLPPMIQMALARNPQAREGWNRMPASHRRAHLLAVFHYRSPESRARRLAKAIQEMRDYAEKRRD